MYGGFQEDKRDFTETFSDDSLGESTRSLLSPVYGDGGRFEPPELSEGSLSSDGEIEDEILDQSEHSWKDYSFDRSNSSAKHRKEKSTTPTNSSFSGVKRSSTKSSTSASTSRSNIENLKSESTKTAESKGNCLSPWETWLVKKSAEDREKTKQRRLQQKKENEQKEKEEREREELLKQASGKYEEWLENKKRVITEESRKKRLQEQLEREKKENSIRLISEAEVKYNSWLENKKAQEKEKRKKEEEEARMKKNREVERKLHNEEAYGRWIAEVKDRPKPVYNSFGYTGGILTGYYEWGSYPAPSYCNPVPWVPPKMKRNNERRKGKMEMQPASPPLLFSDIENRKAKEKRR